LAAGPVRRAADDFLTVNADQDIRQRGFPDIAK
jgi:hypothetical protein